MVQAIQLEADAVIDRALEADLAAAMRRKLDRLARAQALAWQGLTREAQLAYLMAVDKLEGK